jgi:hypothetical protein
MELLRVSRCVFRPRRSASNTRIAFLFSSRTSLSVSLASLASAASSELHDGGLRVKARAGQEDEKGREQTDRSLNDAEHGSKTPCGDDTGERTAQFPH